MAMFSQAKIHWKDDEHQKVGHPSESKMSKTKGIRNKLEVFVNDKPYSQKKCPERQWNGECTGSRNKSQKHHSQHLQIKHYSLFLFTYKTHPNPDPHLRLLDSFDIQFCKTESPHFHITFEAHSPVGGACGHPAKGQQGRLVHWMELVHWWRLMLHIGLSWFILVYWAFILLMKSFDSGFLE